MNINNDNFVIVNNDGGVCGDLENEVYVFQSKEEADAYIAKHHIEGLRVVKLQTMERFQ